MIVYLDTSALVKLYVQETGTEEVRQAVAEATVVATSRVAYPEARAAFARRTREGSLAPEDLRRIVTALNADWETYICVEVTEGISRQAGELSEFLALRGFDSLHLASALALKRRVAVHLRFLTYDDRLRAAAEQMLRL